MQLISMTAMTKIVGLYERMMCELARARTPMVWDDVFKKLEDYDPQLTRQGMLTSVDMKMLKTSPQAPPRRTMVSRR